VLAAESTSGRNILNKTIAAKEEMEESANNGQDGKKQGQRDAKPHGCRESLSRKQS